MSDLARLGTQFYTEGYDATVRQLDQFEKKASGAEKAADGFSSGSRRTGGAIAQMLASIERTVQELVRIQQAQLAFTQGLAEGAAAAVREAQALNTASGAMNTYAGSATKAAAAQSMVGQAQIASLRQQDVTWRQFVAARMGDYMRLEGSHGAAMKRIGAEWRAYKAGAEQAATATAQVSAATDRLTASTDRLGDEAKSTALDLATLYDRHQLDFATQWVAQMGQASTANTRFAGSSKVAQRAGLDLTRQFADIGVSAAMGINLPMILIQQGPQIADSLAMAKMQGMGLNAVLRSLLASAKPLAIALAPLAAVGAGAAAAFGLMHRELSKGFPKDITEGLNLTEEQLERVESRTVTMGDTFKATLDVMGKYLMQGPVGDGIRWLDEKWDALLDFMAKAAFEGTARIMGLFLGAYRFIVANWRNFPAVMGSVFAMAVNAALEAIERLVNASARSLNTLFDLLRMLPQYAWLPRIPEADLSRFKMDVSGAFDFMRMSAQASVEGATQDVRDGLNRIGSEISSGALANARKRALDEAGKARKDREKSKKEEEDAFAEDVRRFNRAVEERRRLAEQFAKFKPEFGTADEPLFNAEREAEELGYIADAFAQTHDTITQMSYGMADAFGQVGMALGGLVSAFTRFDATSSDILARQAEAYAEYLRVKNSDATAAEKNLAERRYRNAEILSIRQLKDAQIDYYASTLSAAKGFFKQGSAGYKVLQTAEQAYRLYQFAMSVKAIFFKGAETAATVTGAATEASAVTAAEAVKTTATVAGTAVRTPLKLAEGAASMFAALGPFGFAAVAAMLAVMASLGFRKGGGSSSNINIAEERQKLQGTGSVLGDSKAKSESLQKALDLVAANTNRDLEYSNDMLKALRSIDANIGALTGLLARQLGVSGGMFDTSDLGLGSVRKPGLLGSIPLIGGLFGKTVKTSLLDQGLSFDPQSLAAILGGGLSGEAYQTVQTQTKKKFLGITTSNKTKTSTSETPIEDQILAEMARVIASLRGGVIAAAGVLGVEGAEAALDAFTVNLGKISFKDMTGEEIQDALNAVFGKLGDDLATAVFGDIAKFQKVGEGAFETLARVARQYQVIDVALQSIGKTFGDVGVASLEARERLLGLFGTLDAFVEQTTFFAENFLTDVERMIPIQAAVEKELTRLGLSGITTKQAFKDLVMGLDLSTESGAQMYAALMALAPAFLKVVNFATEGSKEVEDARQALSEAYEREADALQTTKEKFEGFADSLRKFRQGLETGPAALLSPEAQYFATQTQFEDVARRAKLGDEKALADLQGVSQAYLDASKAYYASTGKYFQDLAAVKSAVQAAEETAGRTASNAEQQLEALKQQVSGLIEINESVLTVAQAIANLQAALTAQTQNGSTGLPPFLGGSGTGAGAGGAFNAAGYLARNPDIVAAYTPYSQGAEPFASYYAAGMTLEQFAKAHYDMVGKSEIAAGTRYPGFAGGGSWTVGGMGGVDSQLMQFWASPGEMVDVRTPGQATNDNSGMEERLDGLTAAVERLERRLAQHGEAVVGSQERGSQRVAGAIREQGQTQRLISGGRA